MDEQRCCVQCGEHFIFRAAEQKYWYEKLKFNFSSVPVRCVRCRRQRRSEAALREQVAAARRAVADAPEDPAAAIALARVICELRERLGAGRLDDAIAASRRARKHWPEASEALLWEGVAQALARRHARAREQLQAFLGEASGPRALVRKARKYLGEDVGAG